MITGEVRLWKLTRKQIREHLAQGHFKAAILPTGSTEQHNEHLAIEHDTASAVHVACQAALALYPQVVVATPIPVGISEHWMEWPGTLTVTRETFVTTAYEICDSLRRHGIEHIFICNGHAGNAPLREHMDEFREKMSTDVRFHSYWEAYSPEFVKEQMESNDCPAHAAEFETSFAQALFPENVHWQGVDYEAEHFDIKSDSYRDDDPIYYRAAHDFATAKKGRVMADAAIDWVADQLRGMLAD